MRIDTKNRVAEMGWVLYSDFLQKTKMATEAQYLVMAYVFDQLQYVATNGNLTRSIRLLKL